MSLERKKQKVLSSLEVMENLEVNLWSRLCTCVVSPDGDKRRICVHVILRRVPGKKEKPILKSGQRNYRVEQQFKLEIIFEAHVQV